MAWACLGPDVASCCDVLGCSASKSAGARLPELRLSVSKLRLVTALFSCVHCSHCSLCKDCRH